MTRLQSVLLSSKHNEKPEAIERYSKGQFIPTGRKEHGLSFQRSVPFARKGEQEPARFEYCKVS